MTDDLETARFITLGRWAKWFTSFPASRKRWWQRLAGRWRGGGSAPPTSPTKVTREVLGRPEKPDSYSFLDGQIAIGVREIAIWRENPAGAFMVGVFRGDSGRVYYSPGTYLEPVVERSMTAKIAAGLRDPIGSWMICRNK